MKHGLEELFSRRLLIQSGKGGAGKTTISAALAVRAAARGKRVLLVEVDTIDRFAQLFGAAEPVGYEVRPLREGIYGLNLDPELVVIDFFKTHLRVKRIYRQIVGSQLFRHFYEAAPGLKELVCIGKIWRMLGERRLLSGRAAWDLVILDAPATGHGLSLLRVPQQAYDTLFGPMKRNAEKIRDTFCDPETTALNIVATPEEMPVTEAIELYREASGQLMLPLGVVFLNASMPPLHDEAERAAFALALAREHAVPPPPTLPPPPRAPGEPAPRERRSSSSGRHAVAVRRSRLADVLGGELAVEAIARCARSREQRAALARQYEARLREAIPLPLVPVPFVFEAGFDVGTLEAVAREIERAFVREPAAPPKRAAGYEGAP